MFSARMHIITSGQRSWLMVPLVSTWNARLASGTLKSVFTYAQTGGQWTKIARPVVVGKARSVLPSRARWHTVRASMAVVILVTGVLSRHGT